MSTIVPFSNKDPEKLFVCPYDKVHTVRACRFNQHLRKCRKNHGGAGYKICVFNQSHHIPEKNFDHHVLNCPDKHVIEQDEEQAQGIQKHNLPPIDFNPVWNKPPSTENWDEQYAEHQQEQEQLRQATEEETEVEDDVFGPGITTLIPERPENWDRMSQTQKKNYKRKYQKQQQKLQEGGWTAADFQRSKNPEDWTEREREDKMKLILTHYPPPTGKINALFIDYKSVLNQFCQKNQINVPKYNEAAGGFGGFACEVIVKGETYISHGTQKTKKDAAHSAAKWALLALEVPEEDQSANTFRPRPVRTAEEMESFRAAHEIGLLHQAGQLPTVAARSTVRPSQGVTRPAQPQPVQPQAPRPQPPRQVAPATMPELIPPAAFAASLNPENDGWTTVPQKSASRGGKGRGRGTALALY